MIDEFLIVNIREYLRQGEDGEDMLRQVFSTFSCKKNVDVERFLLQQSIEFTKKNQSVTYLVMTPEFGHMIGYFTITIKPITVNADCFSNTVKRKIARVSEQDAENGNYSLSAYLIAQLGKNYMDGAHHAITGEQLLGLAIEKVKELQYLAGGMVVFLEAENEERLLNFYEKENGFKRFDTKDVKTGTENAHTLIQLLKVL
ncbi:MAG: GNAT family acetyltransferase [Lachnospiraceae bacterium]